MKYTEEQIKDIFWQELENISWFYKGRVIDVISKGHTEVAMLRMAKRIMADTIEKECTNCGHLFSGEGEYCEICKNE